MNNNNNIYNNLCKYAYLLKNKNYCVSNFISNNIHNNKYQINVNNNILLDYNRNIINNNILYELIKLFKYNKVEKYVKLLFNCENYLNVTENKSVLHVYYRQYILNKEIYNNNSSINSDIKSCYSKFINLVDSILYKKWLGSTNKNIDTIVNIGIGGSLLGNKLLINSLYNYRNNIKVYFISNIDSYELVRILNKINLVKTLFIIISKSFNTQETLTNANYIKNYLFKRIRINKSTIINQHFIAITSNIKKAEKFGLKKENIFKILSEIGGRYSIWSNVGIPTALAIGKKNFLDFIYGGCEIDSLFKNNINYYNNISIILSMLGIWYINFMNFIIHCVIPYDNLLYDLIEYLQQLDMESNGKNINKLCNKIDNFTSPVLLGGIGTNVQHSLFQHFNQSKIIIPSDFIFSLYDIYMINNNKYKLFTNFISCINSLTNNTFNKNLYFKYKNILGNIPINIIICKKISPKTIGNIISIYEYKTFIQGIIWNINSFDQWGVEYAKNINNLLLNKKFKYPKNITDAIKNINFI